MAKYNNYSVIFHFCDLSGRVLYTQSRLIASSSEMTPEGMLMNQIYRFYGLERNQYMISSIHRENVYLYLSDIYLNHLIRNLKLQDLLK